MREPTGWYQHATHIKGLIQSHIQQYYQKLLDTTHNIKEGTERNDEREERKRDKIKGNGQHRNKRQ